MARAISGAWNAFDHLLSSSVELPPTVPGLVQMNLLSAKVTLISVLLDFPGGSNGKASVYNAGDPGSIPGSGRSPAGEHGHPLQYSCPENPMDRGAWRATVHKVAQS